MTGAHERQARHAHARDNGRVEEPARVITALRVDEWGESDGNPHSRVAGTPLLGLTNPTIERSNDNPECGGLARVVVVMDNSVDGHREAFGHERFLLAEHIADTRGSDDYSPDQRWLDARFREWAPFRGAVIVNDQPMATVGIAGEGYWLASTYPESPVIVGWGRTGEAPAEIAVEYAEPGADA